jgi:agmatine/peptidylarginine deiminase
MAKTFCWLLLTVLLYPVAFVAAQPAASNAIAPRPAEHEVGSTALPRFPRIAGEFEPQKAILLSVSDLQPHHAHVLRQIVQHSADRVPIIILCNNAQQLAQTVGWLEEVPGSKSHVSFYQLELDTIWLRDFGPRIAETESGTMSIDFFYDGQRPLDDSFPVRWGDVTRAEINKVPWTMHGGNLICNGEGLGITTNRIYEDNYIRFIDPLPAGKNPEIERRKMVDEAFKTSCNLNELLVLEPLREEATQHVDMFAQLLAKDHILVAQLDPRVDPVNAQILDANARRLGEVMVDGHPLKVDRIQIPPRMDRAWSPYTNTISANKMILMPTFKSDDPGLVENALATYRRLLPEYYVAAIDTTSMQQLQGSLHCMSVNIPQFAPLPSGLVSYQRALDYWRTKTRPDEAGKPVGQSAPPR